MIYLHLSLAIPPSDLSFPLLQRKDGVSIKWMWRPLFLHGSTKEEVYVEQPLGLEVWDRDTHVCWLKKSLYGLKQAPRAWYERIDSYLMKLGFTRSNVDPKLYFKVDRERPLILVLYVDYFFLIGADPLIHQCKRELASNFEMKYLGLMHYFLGLEVC